MDPNAALAEIRRLCAVLDKLDGDSTDTAIRRRSRTFPTATYVDHVCTYGYRTELMGNGYVRVDSPAQLVTLTFPDGRHYSGYRLPHVVTQAIAKLYGGAA